MQKNNRLMELNRHLTDAEIMCAIRYLDPDVFADKTEADADTGVGTCITLLTALVGALAYIYLYSRTL